MNRALTATTLVTLVLIGCSSEPDQARTVPDAPTPNNEEASDGDESTTEPEEEEPEPDLDELVLTLDAMPSGWTTAPELLEDDDTADTEFCGVDEGEVDIGDEAGVSSEAAFKQSDMGPFVMHVVGWVDDPSVATDAMDSLLEAASDCDEWTETETEGGETTYTISPLSFEHVGDDTISFRIDWDSEGFPLTMDLVIWRDGHYLSLVVSLGIGGTDAELLTDMVEKAADRL